MESSPRAKASKRLTTRAASASMVGSSRAMPRCARKPSIALDLGSACSIIPCSKWKRGGEIVLSCAHSSVRAHALKSKLNSDPHLRRKLWNSLGQLLANVCNVCPPHAQKYRKSVRILLESLVEVVSERCADRCSWRRRFVWLFLLVHKFSDSSRRRREPHWPDLKNDRDSGESCHISHCSHWHYCAQ